MSNWGERYLDHCERFLGEHTDSKSYQHQDLPWKFQVLWYDGVFPDCRLFTTLGLSHYPERLGGICEVITVCDDGWDAVPLILAAAFEYFIVKPVRVLRGSAIDGLQHIDPDFVARFGKNTLYISLPYLMLKGFAHLSGDGEVGHLYFAAFLSQAEYDYLAAHGPDALEDLLERAEVDPLHLARASSV